tara:strand:+ start:716 stop:904 length:189 start_codon:yes stop_codon:yes gene_type:complete
VRNSDDPAFPIIVKEGEWDHTSVFLGLSKREYFALHFAQNPDSGVHGAIYLADELLKLLEET